MLATTRCRRLQKQSALGDTQHGHLKHKGP